MHGKEREKKIKRRRRSKAIITMMRWSIVVGQLIDVLPGPKYERERRARGAIGGTKEASGVYFVGGLIYISEMLYKSQSWKSVLRQVQYPSGLNFGFIKKKKKVV